MCKLWLKHLLPYKSKAYFNVFINYSDFLLLFFSRRLPLLISQFCTFAHLAGFSRLLTLAQCVCLCVALVSLPAVMVYCPGRCSCHWTSAEPVPTLPTTCFSRKRGERNHHLLKSSTGTTSMLWEEHCRMWLIWKLHLSEVVAKGS